MAAAAWAPAEALTRLAAAADDVGRRAVVDDAPARWQTFLRVLAAGPEPAEAARRGLGLRPTAARPPPLALARLLHQGSYPARLAALVDDLEGALADEEDATAGAPLDATLDALDPVIDRVGVDEAIGRARTREYLRLCRLEVEGASLERIGAALSALVEGCVGALLRHHGIEQDVAVFGMGKLGGDELNFLSDIDLLFVHTDALSDEGPQRVVALHDALRSVVRALEGSGRYRPLFRVDLRLRPFGARGPLSMSVSATERYYERHGRAWERQVWLRARPLAGATSLAREVMARLRPFVYRRSVTPAIFEEVAALMARARREHGDVLGDPGGIDLKLDEGGIRGVEFTVQALQLLHAGKNPSLRTPGTLRALDRLLAAGLVSDREHRELTDAYRFLRRVEHRVQLAEGQQTHVVPSADDTRRRLAARLGISPDDDGDDDGDPLPAFDRALARHRAHVLAIARTMSGDADSANDDRSSSMAVVLDSGAPPSVRRDALARLGVYDPDECEALLSHLFARDDTALASRGPAREGAERLLAACLEGADPDAALVRFARFARDRPAHYGIWRWFAAATEAGHDQVRLTAELLSTSDTIAAGLIGFAVGRGKLPDDTIWLLSAASDPKLPDPPRLVAALESAPLDPRGLDATLLRFKHHQLVHVGLQDLARRPDPHDVGRSLSNLADLILRWVLRDLAAEPTERTGPAFSLAVLAVGKHGMAAMDYASDLDLLFVWAPAEDAPAEPGHDATAGAGPAATRFAQRLIARLSDRALGMRLFEIDTRLRPSGRQGLLVTSLESFRRYHARELPVWEKLAMLRMRAVAEVEVGVPTLAPQPGEDAPLEEAGLSPGPEAAAATMASALPGPVAQEAIASVHEHLFTRADGTAPPRAEVGAAVGDLKRRIEREIARESRGSFDVKSGLGGCLETELLVAALQLLHGRDGPAGVRHRGVVPALRALTDHGVLSPADADALIASYTFQRRLLNRLRMMHATGSREPDRFAQNSPKLMTLARRMGLPDRDALVAHFHHCRSAVRRAIVQHLPECALPLPEDGP